MDRIQWDDLPVPLTQAIRERTGPILSGEAVTDGQNSPLAAVIETEGGKRFLKGIPIANKRNNMLDREVAAAPLVAGISPPLLTWFEDAGWKVLIFEHLDGRSAKYTPGNADLGLIPRLMERLSKVEVPEGHGPIKLAEDRYKEFTDTPEVLAGGSLIHTDWMPDNVLISGGRAWLVDWAWATLGAGWIDPACWVLRMIAWGHSAKKAEAWGRLIESYADADPKDVNVFVTVNVRMWEDIAADMEHAWIQTMLNASREWADYRNA